MKRALITGGTGFVGANLARRLLRDGHEVHLLVRPDYHSWRIDSIKPDLRLHTASITDAEALTRAVRAARPDWVFHLAAYGAYPTQQDTKRMFDTNVLGTIKLLDACLADGFEAFVHAGSSSEYGRRTEPHSETDPPSRRQITPQPSSRPRKRVAGKPRRPAPRSRLSVSTRSTDPTKSPPA